MLPSCKQAAEELSNNLDESISGLKWLKLKIHLLMCRYCRQYGKQLEISSKTIHLIEKPATPSDSFKNKMVEQYKDCCRDKNNNV